MKTRMIRFAVVVAGMSLTLALPVRGQFQIDNSHSQDANNRVGTTLGRNDQGLAPAYGGGNQLWNGNQIITGNVTAGREFMGGLGYTSPSELRTNTAGMSMDQFIKNSAGIPSPYRMSQAPMISPQAFYGASSTAEPPPGFIRNPQTGAYVPELPQRGPMPNDTRIGLVSPGGYNPVDIGLIQPGSAMWTQQGLVTGSPMLGLNPAEAPPELSSQFSGNPLGLSAYGSWRRPDPWSKSRISDQAIQQMRRELNGTLVRPGNEQNDQENNAQSISPPPFQGAGAVSAESMNAEPMGGSISPTALNGQPLGVGPGMPQTSGALVVPARQSTLYAQLQQRLTQFETNRRGTQPGQPGQPGQLGQPAQPGPQLGQPGQPGQPAQPGQVNPAGPQAEQPPAVEPYGQRSHEILEGAGRNLEQRSPQSQLYPPTVPQSNKPMEITSLATGIQAKGLHGLMVDAERLMKEGKFASALERYDAAEEVAPNSPLVWLGRAQAELGAGYYARADRDLRQALSGDPALLMGRYDLNAFLGPQRLDYIVRDLKDIANSQKDDVHSPFLLAYIAYNTGHPEMASEYLNLAEQRAGKNDPVLRLIREHWTLPSAPGTGK